MPTGERRTEIVKLLMQGAAAFRTGPPMCDHPRVGSRCSAALIYLDMGHNECKHRNLNSNASAYENASGKDTFKQICSK